MGTSRNQINPLRKREYYKEGRAWDAQADPLIRERVVYPRLKRSYRLSAGDEHDQKIARKLRSRSQI